MKHLKPILAVVLLGSVAVPTIAAADARPDPARPFFWQLLDHSGQERLAGRFRGDDDDNDRGWRGDRDDDDDDDSRGRGDRDDDDDGGGRNDDDD